jgi:imidazoleglycerol-phosphate dehydratase
MAKNPLSSTQHRKTRETDIRVDIDLRNAPEARISTGLPFFDHMLTAVSFHGGLGMSVTASGDTDVDAHHTVEDAGIVLGEALNELREGNPGIRRFGNAVVPMDDALAEVAVDLGGRAYLVWQVEFPQEYAGSFQLPLLREFFHGVAAQGRCNIHVHGRYGRNGHHLAEAVCKAFGVALYNAFRPGPYADVTSTKGSPWQTPDA